MKIDHKLDVYFHNVSTDQASTEIIGLLAQLTRKVDIMAGKQDVLDAMTRERQQIIDAFTAANTAQDVLVTDLQTQITDLKAKVDGGAAVTAADFDELLAAVDAIYNPDAGPVLPPPVVVTP